VILAGVLAIAAAGWWWHGRGTTRTSASGVALGAAPEPGPLNLLIVTLDTTRADRIGAYGLADAGTPARRTAAGRGVMCCDVVRVVCCRSRPMDSLAR